LIFLVSCQNRTRESGQGNSEKKEKNYELLSRSIINFAGNKTPLEIEDVKERLDRGDRQ
jgi:hypothetical protein